MTANRHTIDVVNRLGKDHSVMLEPLGEEFALPSGKTMTISTDHGTGRELEIVLRDDRVGLWLLAGPDYDDTLTVTVDGQPLPR